MFHSILTAMHIHTAPSKVENSAQVSSCSLKFVHAVICFTAEAPGKSFLWAKKKFFKDPNYRGIAIFGLKTFFPRMSGKKMENHRLKKTHSTAADLRKS